MPRFDPDKWVDSEGKIRSKNKDDLVSRLDQFYNSCHDPDTGEFCGDLPEGANYNRRPRPAIIDGDKAYIPLSDTNPDIKATVDVDNLDKVKDYRWDKNSHGYASTYINGKPMKMHHLLFGKPPEGKEWDHKNKSNPNNKLDNRRDNLRLASRSQNQKNVGAKVTNKVGYKGVYESKPGSNSWVARIFHEGKRHNLGTYDTPEEAAESYNKASKEFDPEFGHQNKIPGKD